MTRDPGDRRPARAAGRAWPAGADPASALCSLSRIVYHASGSVDPGQAAGAV